MSKVERCVGCGSMLPKIDGPTHAYIRSSPACWAAYGKVLEREYSNPALMSVHCLTVDTWSVQHPGDGTRQAIQSVGLHLARLMVQLDEATMGENPNAFMRGFAAHKAELPELPPRAAYAMTVADVASASQPEDHMRAVRAWAEATWRDWADQHDFIRAWARSACES